MRQTACGDTLQGLNDMLAYVKGDTSKRRVRKRIICARHVRDKNARQKESALGDPGWKPGIFPRRGMNILKFTGGVYF